MTEHFTPDSTSVDQPPLPARSPSPITARAGARSRPGIWHVITCLALASVVVALVLRWGSPSRPLLIAIAGLMPLFAVPLVIGVAGSLLSKSPTLRVVAAVITASFLYTTSPVDAVIGCRAESAADEITVYTANVLSGVGRQSDIAEAILRADPDVFVLQEVTWEFVEPLRDNPSLAQYQYRTDDTPSAGHGKLVWSRWPIADVTVDRIAESELINARIAGPTGEFTVTAVHTLAPVLPENVPIWQTQLAQLTTVDQEAPRLMAGDFNATTDHRPFRRLLDSGWTDVHDRKGCGFDTTWPIDGQLPFAVYRLDHVLVSDHFEVLGVRLGEPGGSDHLPVIASIRLR